MLTNDRKTGRQTDRPTSLMHNELRVFSGTPNAVDKTSIESRAVPLRQLRLL